VADVAGTVVLAVVGTAVGTGVLVVVGTEVGTVVVIDVGTVVGTIVVTGALRTRLTLGTFVVWSFSTITISE